jgi:hypothetical protein
MPLGETNCIDFLPPHPSHLPMISGASQYLRTLIKKTVFVLQQFSPVEETGNLCVLREL